MKKLLKRLCSAMVAAVMVMTMAPAAFAAGGGAQFQNGPYLLAPKTNSMVVVWESTEKVSATIAYGTDDAFDVFVTSVNNSKHRHRLVKRYTHGR